jgi:hypothetical protein
MPLKEHFKLHITSNKKTHCEINSHEIFDEHVDEIVALLNQQRHVTSLEIGQTNISDNGVKKLNKLEHVTNLSLPRNNFSDEGAIELVRNSKFQSLNFHGNKAITNRTGEVMASESTQIFLKLSDTAITLACKEKINSRIALNQKNRPYHPTANVSPLKQRFFEEKKSDEETNRFNEMFEKARQDRSDISMVLVSHKL